MFIQSLSYARYCVKNTSMPPSHSVLSTSLWGWHWMSAHSRGEEVESRQVKELPQRHSQEMEEPEFELCQPDSKATFFCMWDLHWFVHYIELNSLTT